MRGWKRWAALLSAVGLIATVIVVLQVTIAPSSGTAKLTAKGEAAPEFTGLAGWINGEPRTVASLRGKVVLVDFWDYTCINCLRTLPYLRDWHAKYSPLGLVIIGIHTPEFDFEKREANVRAATVREGITWPVGLDNDYATWEAYDNRYWPHKYLVDQNGILRYDHIGEGAYLETEQQIRKLLEEGGRDLSTIPLGKVDDPASQARITRELYAGHGWSLGRYLGNAENAPLEKPTHFSDPGVYQAGQFYLQGTWQVNRESVQHVKPTQDFEDYVVIDYLAASVNAVVRPQGDQPFPVLLTLDGKPLGKEDRGIDVQVDAQGRTYINVDTPRLYNLVRSAGVSPHRLKLHANSTDFSLYTFTFGA